MASLEPNGELGKLRGYLVILKDIFNTFGLPVIILVVLLLLYTGVMPSPLLEAKGVLENLKVSIDRHLERDNEIIFYMKSMCVSNAKLAQTPVEDCLWRGIDK